MIWRMRTTRLGEMRLRGRRARSAFTVPECLVALAVLGVAAALLGQLLGEVAQQRRAADRQAGAWQEAANLLEQLSVIPFAELTPERAARVGLSDLARQHLPDARLEISLTSATSEPSPKQIQVSLRWRDRSGRYGAPVQLTAWRHQREGSEP